MRDLLVHAESLAVPSDEFVEELSAELMSVLEADAGPLRSRKRLVTLWALAGAALVATVLGVSSLVGSEVSSPDVPVAVGTGDDGLPVASGDMPLSISNACDAFLVEVASVLRPGMGQTISAPTGTRLSASSLYQMRDRLGHIADLYVLHGRQSPLADYGFSEAISELGEAALFVQLGEFSQAEEHLATTRALIGDLADEPGLRGCLEL